MKRNQSGFTLVEIAIVLVIIGLLLGGILKGQELVQNARVRNLADQQNAVAAAYFAFQDRYRALPGDYAAANSNIPNVGTTPCGGGGCVQGDSQITGDERVFAWHHLTNAGFISCPVCAPAPGAAPVPSAANSMVNAYNGFMVLEYANNYAIAAPAPAAPNINHLKSGAQVPSNIMSEVDQKLDDGNPSTGKFRVITGAGAAGCLTATGAWQAQTPVPSCEAVNLF
jgi:prepilin-type N-terminal cleavage/methylation domain-containing protein